MFFFSVGEADLEKTILKRSVVGLMEHGNAKFDLVTHKPGEQKGEK